MNFKEKEIIKLKLGICLQHIISANKGKATENREAGKEDVLLVTSLRKLEAASGIDFSTIQRISVGDKNAEFSTLVALADGLNITPSELIAYYPEITSKEISELQKKKEELRKKKDK